MCQGATCERTQQTHQVVLLSCAILGTRICGAAVG